MVAYPRRFRARRDIMGFLRVFNEAGLSAATLQREDISQAQVSNLFWVNLALGSSVSVTLACAFPLVAWFYREPRLVWVTLLLSISFLLTASSVHQMAVLKRQMRFSTLAVIELRSITFISAEGNSSR